MAGIDTMTPYRDPRTAFGGNVRAARPRIPVGEVTEFFADTQPAPAQPAAPAAAATESPAARAPRRGTMPRASIGVIGPAAGVALGAAPEALDVGKVLANPAATGIDVATQASEGAGRMASAGAGALGGAKLGTMAAPFLGPLAPVGPVAGSILGGLAGYFSADKAIKGGRAAAGVDPASPVDRVPAAPAAPQAQAAPTPTAAAPAAKPYSNARDGPAVPDAGVIRYDPKTKTYSGADVKAGADITGGIGGGRGTGRGNVTTMPTLGVEGYQRQLANIRGLGPAPDSTEGQGAAGIGGGRIGSDLRAATDAVAPSDIARLSKGGRAGRAQAATLLKAQEQEQGDARAARSADLVQRGQDIGAATQQAGAANQRDIAVMQGRTQRDIAELTSEGRIAAAEARANPTVVVGGGSVPVDDGMGGVKYVPAPQRLVNRVTGEEIGARPQQPAAPSAPPAKGAVVKKGDTSYRFKGGDPSKPESWEKV